MSLRLDWASREAAKFAVERWHYSRCLPAFGMVTIGVWEDGQFIGVVIFSRGANANIAKPYGLKQTEVVELTRVALRSHKASVSRILSIAVKMFRRHCPGIKVIVSYADTTQGHHGGIYQAAGWIYEGATRTEAIRIHGKPIHTKSLHSRYGAPGQNLEWLRRNIDPLAARVQAVKHKYSLVFDEFVRQGVVGRAKPYPKRSDAPEIAGPQVPPEAGRCDSDPGAPI